MSVQRSVTAQVLDVSVAGQWRLYARRPGHAPVEITYVRDTPTTYGSWSLADPFGPKSASLTFPKITLWDALGVDDLYWCAYGTDVDIVWDGPVPFGYPGDAFRIETYMTSFDVSTTGGLEVQLQGAMYQIDNYLAKPEYPARPIPYEVAIANCFDGHPDSRLAPFKIEFPHWWDDTFPTQPRERPLYLIPTGVKTGDKWTGLVTRSTGNFDPCLTSYAQSLLATMYTERGRWTLDLDPFRKPVLRHRDVRHVDDAQLLVIDPATPGVNVSLSVDWSQSLNVAYGQGTSAAGEGYTGQIISNDGARTTYEPLAAMRQVEPVSDENGWLETSRMRKEVALQLQTGLSLTQAQAVGQAHLQRYSDPGITGTITLTVDPMFNGSPLLRFLIKAGMAIRLPNAFGDSVGPVLHISEVSADLGGGTVTLTVDSKFRDALTVDEVRERGRDALAVVRQLIGGQYNPPIPDQLLPWNYAEGSGYIPSGPEFNALPLFEGMPDDIRFPYEEWTTQRPPSDLSWRRCYIKIPARSSNADENWASSSSEGLRLAFPIKMAQAGAIRRLQIAAYDRNGAVMPVRFHVSLYYANGTGVMAMPVISPEDIGTTDGYKVGEHYPFFAGAWENFKTDGTRIQREQPVSVSSAGLIRAWGNRYVKAGYWPGSPFSEDLPTGLLVDEGVFEFDTTQQDVNFNPHTPRQVSPLSGRIYAMIYCDEQMNDSVFFVGRMFRVEPGAVV